MSDLRVPYVPRAPIGMSANNAARFELKDLPPLRFGKDDSLLVIIHKLIAYFLTSPSISRHNVVYITVIKFVLLTFYDFLYDNLLSREKIIAKRTIEEELTAIVNTVFESRIALREAWAAYKTSQRQEDLSAAFGTMITGIKQLEQTIAAQERRVKDRGTAEGILVFYQQVNLYQPVLIEIIRQVLDPGQTASWNAAGGQRKTMRQKRRLQKTRRRNLK